MGHGPPRNIERPIGIAAFVFNMLAHAIVIGFTATSGSRQKPVFKKVGKAWLRNKTRLFFVQARTRSYTPPPSEIQDYNRVAAALGIDRAVVVQASVYAEDNAATLQVSAADPERLRAVVSVANDVSDAELEAYHAAGARGIRVNIVDIGGMTFPSVDDALAFTARIADLGWHIEFLAHVETFEDIHAVLAKSRVPMVFGHLGYTNARKGVGDPGFQRFLEAFEEGQTWVKLTGPYRISALDRPPYKDVSDMAQALIATNPSRLLWGSDWPHVRHVGVMPNDGTLLDQLADWGCDARLRKQILVDNPAELYGFPELPA